MKSLPRASNSVSTPGFGPALVAHTVEEASQCRQSFRLAEATAGTPDEPDALATIGVQLGILSDIFMKVQSALMEALEIGAAADPTSIDGRKHQAVSARSTRLTISWAISSHERARSC